MNKKVTQLSSSFLTQMKKDKISYLKEMSSPVLFFNQLNHWDILGIIIALIDNMVITQ